MSSRALRKAQREREEQDRLSKLEGGVQEGVDEDDASTQPAKKSAFAMLGEEEDEAEDDGDEVEGEHIDNDAQQIPRESATESVPKPSTKKKKKKKKGKSGGGTPSKEHVVEDEQMDEIDKALKQLATNGNASLAATTASGVDQQTEEVSKLLSIDTSHLHAQNEMRRLFGRAALEQQDDDEQPQNAAAGGNRRQQRRVQQVGLAQALRGQQGGGRQGGLAAMALRRNIFIHGKEEWPNATGGGLGMEVEEKRADGTVLYRYVHNTAYLDVQRQFSIAVESMDPNRLILLLQQNPYHIATLLQVSEIAKQDRNHSVSGDLLERALFSFGRAVHSSFSKTLAEGRARLDFRRPQNRELWLASWRYMQNLSMRATWRTVYEWAKLLIQLSPDDDPYALWLVLDQYALRARQDLDYLNLSRNANFKQRVKDMPNVQLSQGLAESRAGNKSKGQQTLFTAIGRYPWVVFRLMQELSLDPPPAIWGKEPRTEKEKLYSELYATRAKDVWGTPEASALLVETASALQPDTQAAAAEAEGEISESEARHVLLSDTPSLISLIPRHFTEQLASSSDPLPPSDTYASPEGTGTTPANHSQLSSDEVHVELLTLSSWLEDVFPWFPHGEEPPVDEILQTAQDNNVEPGELGARLRRFDQLRQMALTRGLHIETETPFDQVEVEDGGLRARVDDAEDAGD
ncbi:hypothetical protein LTR37_002341 [Vermiconidia calcicola]|uniref:Uncharacterized protein n=1 Tax=Vermiconidia calcicola TaxID=1690605 RepID=A0ACC3NTD0_9PEZI|nr:hypothetical protein LTR37_002341 [Vermiconidia calcicola]